MMKTLATFSFRHRWLVVVAWIAAVVGATMLASAVGGEYADGGRLVGTDSDSAYELINRESPDNGAHTVTVALHHQAGIVAAQGPIERFIKQVGEAPGVLTVESPFPTEQGGGGGPGRISADGTVAIVNIDTSIESANAAATAAVTAIDKAAETLRADGVEVDYADYAFATGSAPASELFGLAAAVVILLIAFGSVVAMGLPLLTAIVGIAIGLAGVGIWTGIIDTPDFTVEVASMVGVGVGIDYALFIVTRYREALARTKDPESAVVEAIATAGRAVLFAGSTVVISLMGMFLMGLSFLYGLALGTATAVVVAVAAALTLLPAMLGFAGHKLDRWSIHRRQTVVKESIWHRWSRTIQRHPKAFAATGLAVLLAAGAPTVAMRMAVADMGNDPVGSTTRSAYDLISDGFGPGFNGPLVVAVETPSAPATQDAAQLATRIAALKGVSMVSDPIPSQSGRAALIQVIPATSPQDIATERLVHELRRQVITQSGLTAHVGGPTASDIDFSHQMATRLPVFIGAVLLLSFLLLLTVFRSVLVALKAVVLNLLSIGAAYGVMVAVFQWGWGGSLLHVAKAPVEPWAPMMLFAIVFGLSMDYEVFLLSSIKERYDRSNDNSEAVVEGLAATARVITAAAAIMVCVFGPFVFGEDRGIKLIGLGLATAVFIDATVVRMILVPATMELLGNRNWWIPRWLDRVLPHLTVEQPASASVPAGRPLPAPTLPEPELVH